MTEKLEIDLLVLKYAPWSISKAGAIQRCQRQYSRKYLQKLPEGPSPKSGRAGTAVHYVLERGLVEDNCELKFLKLQLENIAQEKKLLVQEVLDSQTFLTGCADFIKRIRKFKLKFGVKNILIEYKLGVMPDFTPSVFFDNNSLLRGVIDLALITQDDLLIVIDHKTGKPKPITFHHEQIYSYALMCAAHFPVKGVQGAIHYVGEPELSRMNTLTRDYIEIEIKAWFIKYLNKLTESIKLVESPNPPYQTGWMCEWCPYVFEPECPEGMKHVKKKGHLPPPSDPNI